MHAEFAMGALGSLLADTAGSAVSGRHTGWEVVGWCGNALFASRFIVQWIASERKRQVSVPAAFWWLSLGGSLVSLVYAIAQKNPVWIAGQAIAWVPYIRNLRLHYSHHAKQTTCPECSAKLVPDALYCHRCGTPCPTEGEKRLS
ncbi:MAG TPA: lipid-A-disaccharide synthase N-terminal domain-containing protein [Candidatus Limnocylindria bacterium]|nr:lipid-A-disaccharide synthase N-terminal domain-containing protein [Candidatus Limnocylindria bacterium]